MSSQQLLQSVSAFSALTMSRNLAVAIEACAAASHKRQEPNTFSRCILYLQDIVKLK